MSSYGHGARMFRRGPYGTNEGDMWLAGEVDALVRADKGPGWRVVVEMMRNAETGALEERIYTTENPEMVAAADAGNELYIAEQAARN